MPTYAQIQTYASCTPDTFYPVIRRYWDALARLGCKEQAVSDWLDGIFWPDSEDEPFGDIYATTVTLTPASGERITCAGLSVSLYAESAVPTIDEPPSWVGFNLLLDTTRLKPSEVDPYHKRVGRVIWHILLELSKTFPEVGAYLTDEWQENLSWRAIVEESGDPWSFDLGIFPRQLSERFKQVPTGFEGTVIDGAFGFALANRWSILPWNEAAESSS